MKIYGTNYGGFGNAVFNKLGTILLWILFSPNAELVSFDTMEEIDEYKQNSILIDEFYFVNIVNSKIEKGIDILDPEKNYFFSGYSQHDEIYTRYKKQIVDYILAHPLEKIYVAHENRFLPIYHIVAQKNTETYDIVLHLRLGDFVRLGWTIHPECVRQVFENVLSSIDAVQNEKQVAILVDHQETELENQYVEYIRSVCPEAIVYDKTDIFTAYNLMRNAKRMICSCSTFSWIATLFAREYQRVSFPNYEHRWQHEYFRKVHENFTYYNISRISETDLQQFLSG